jgi:hypothetical protein
MTRTLGRERIVVRVAYALRGVLGSPAVLAACSAFDHARGVALDQGLRLLVVTDEFDVDLGPKDPVAVAPPLSALPAGFDRVLAACSVRGPVAYVEAEYFGGVGRQAAAVWDNGDLVLGPLTTAEDSPIPSPSPISQALRRLGVSADGHFDEFEAVGLGRHRDHDGWLDEAM